MFFSSRFDAIKSNDCNSPWKAIYHYHIVLFFSGLRLVHYSTIEIWRIIFSHSIFSIVYFNIFRLKVLLLDVEWSKMKVCVLNAFHSNFIFRIKRQSKHVSCFTAATGMPVVVLIYFFRDSKIDAFIKYQATTENEWKQQQQKML